MHLKILKKHALHRAHTLGRLGRYIDPSESLLWLTFDWKNVMYKFQIRLYQFFFIYLGNNWDCDETGCDNGLGRQEQFINCADIAILDNCSFNPTTSPVSTGIYFSSWRKTLYDSKIIYNIGSICTNVSVQLAPWNRFKPSSKISTDHSKAVLLLWIFYVFSVLYLLCLCVCLFICVPCGHLLGKGWPLGSRLWCITVSLSLSHWYPGSGMLLDCIDSWSLHPYLPWYQQKFSVTFRNPL